MAFLLDIYGKKSSPASSRLVGTNELGLNWATSMRYGQTSRRASDGFGGLHARGAGFQEPARVARKLVDWYAKSNAIAALCWHWARRWGEGCLREGDSLIFPVVSSKARRSTKR